MPFMIMQHDVDPAENIKKEMGDVAPFDVFRNQVLVAVYIRPQKTKSGIFLTDKTTDEDRFQSKVGLVIKKGPTAFVDETGQWFDGVSISEGDWVVFRPSDGWSITVNGVLCRIIDDVVIRGKVDHPDRVW